jgi:hypothetical protein
MTDEKQGPTPPESCESKDVGLGQGFESLPARHRFNHNKCPRT